MFNIKLFLDIFSLILTILLDCNFLAWPSSLSNHSYLCQLFLLLLNCDRILSLCLWLPVSCYSSLLRPWVILLEFTIFIHWHSFLLALPVIFLLFFWALATLELSLLTCVWMPLQAWRLSHSNIHLLTNSTNLLQYLSCIIYKEDLPVIGQIGLHKQYLL